ncbi:unnamed protein product [Heterobilharzia americana]|nr:unnamed protein product [Heterobilharzia americana]
MCMRVSPTDSGNSGILFVGFNQDYGCFAVGMQNGFRIFNSDPLKQLQRYEFDIRDGTGVGYIEMLFRTNLLGVRLRHDRIIVVLVNAIKVYTFSPSPQLVFESKTCSNPLGLCYVCQSVDNPLVVAICPSSTNATNMPPRQIIAHENPLASISLNRDGYLLATASQKGTLIRVFSTKDCSLLHELRRGTSQATITSLSFNKDSELLCVTSERGTAHIFCLTKDTSCNPRNMPTGSNSPRFMKPPGSGSGKLFPRSLFSTTSHVRCVLETKFKAICAFSVVSPDTLIVLAADGSYYKYTFTANGTVTRVTYVNFLDFYDDETDF